MPVKATRRLGDPLLDPAVDTFRQETLLQNQAFPVAYAEEMIGDQAARSAARLASQTSA